MHAGRTFLTATLFAIPLLSAEAQTRRRPAEARGGPPSLSATDLLDARRQLDLSPRQVARLDSIERSQVTQRRSFVQQMQKQRDSVCANRNPCRLSQEERESLRGRTGRNGSDTFFRNDSVGRSLAFSLLDSTQRGRVQGWRQGQRRTMMARGGRMGPQVGPRGRERSWREQGKRPRAQGRSFAPREERRGMDRDVGPRMRRPGMPRDNMGPGFGPGRRRMDRDGRDAGSPARPDTLPDRSR